MWHATCIRSSTIGKSNICGALVKKNVLSICRVVPARYMSECAAESRCLVASRGDSDSCRAPRFPTCWLGFHPSCSNSNWLGRTNTECPPEPDWKYCTPSISANKPGENQPVTRRSALMRALGQSNKTEKRCTAIGQSRTSHRQALRQVKQLQANEQPIPICYASNVADNRLPVTRATHSLRFAFCKMALMIGNAVKEQEANGKVTHWVLGFVQPVNVRSRLQRQFQC